MRPYSPEAVEEVFGPPVGGPDLPENLSKAELAQALRDWQEENPGDDLAASLTGGIPYAAADLAASNELDEPLWMQLLYAAGVLPGLAPASKLGRKAWSLLSDLPEGGMKNFLADDIKYSVGDEGYQRIVDMFTPEGDLRTLHGSSQEIPKFTTEGLERILREGGGDINVGPGTYTADSLDLPLIMGSSGGKPLNLYELITDRDDLGSYMALDFLEGRNRWKFADQTEQVKDALSMLYPNVPDNAKMDLFRRSRMGTDFPDIIKSKTGNLSQKKLLEMANTIREGQDLPDFAAANKALREAGIGGNVHMEVGRNFTHFDPDALTPGTMRSAMPDEWRQAQRSLKNLNPRKTPRPEDVFKILEEEDALALVPGFEDMYATPAALEGLDLLKFDQ